MGVRARSMSAINCTNPQPMPCQSLCPSDARYSLIPWPLGRARRFPYATPSACSYMYCSTLHIRCVVTNDPPFAWIPLASQRAIPNSLLLGYSCYYICRAIMAFLTFLSLVFLLCVLTLIKRFTSNRAPKIPKGLKPLPGPKGVVSSHIAAQTFPMRTSKRSAAHTSYRIPYCWKHP
jgi:hypothetical protein